MCVKKKKMANSSPKTPPRPHGHSAVFNVSCIHGRRPQTAIEGWIKTIPPSALLIVRSSCKTSLAHYGGEFQMITMASDNVSSVSSVSSGRGAEALRYRGRCVWLLMIEQWSSLPYYHLMDRANPEYKKTKHAQVWQRGRKCKRIWSPKWIVGEQE